MTGRHAFGELGYHLEESVFDPDEVDELRAVAEEVASRVAVHAQRDGAGPEALLADGHRIQFSSRAGIQWEWNEGSNEIRLIEPADHLHPRIAALFTDPRLTGPVQHVLGVEQLGPFTSKLNLKRAREGSQFPWHQDYPYWCGRRDERRGRRDGDRVPRRRHRGQRRGSGAAGSHLNGPAPRDPNDPTHFLTDPARLDPDREVLVEVPAGSVLWFGAFLVPRSSPNATGQHRRALLPSWQPAGRPRLHDLDYVPERVHDLP